MSGQTPFFFAPNKDAVDSSDIKIEGGTQNFSIEDPLDKSGIDIEPVAKPSNANFELEKFMAEKVVVILAEPGDEKESQFAEITVNGDYVCIPRDGNEHTIRRYHLEILARAKQSRVKQNKIVGPDGSMGFQEQNVMALSYPFQLVRDDNRHGRAWLKSITRNPG